MTAGVAELPLDVKARALIQVQTFTKFNADNDPYGEHDFGSFEVAGDQFFWKLDYYDRDMMSGSPDPSDPEQTTRVLAQPQVRARLIVVERIQSQDPS